MTAELIIKYLGMPIPLRNGVFAAKVEIDDELIQTVEKEKLPEWLAHEIGLFIEGGLREK